ncbi:MAG: 23S rRNA (adenine(2503)-C(2))-methyltransferase RlmN [Spirochaetales bacterium]|nr:23S rRNA (adenine(2503)-C(2))-methyltransferase RlmN [Spirochaetales bacterium]
MEKLYGKTLSELQELLSELGEPGFRAKQLADWLYNKGADSLEEMTNLSKNLRQKLGESCEIGRTAPQKESCSTDGTKKYLFPTEKGNYIESAWIPDRERSTLCLSTQGGCKWGCKFCMTGTMGLKEQLTATGILNQYGSLPQRTDVTNFVFMGMGEPLDNTENLLKSLEVLTSPWGYALSPRRITVSTVGIIPGLERFLAESDCHLAYSLHNPFPEERAALMPVEKKYPLHDVMNLLKDNRELFKGQRRVTIEYTLIEGENDKNRHAEELVRVMNGLKARVNLISYNAGTDLPWHGVSRERAEAFRDFLNSKGVTATIRNSRGGDIEAACGLLSVKQQN